MLKKINFNQIFRFTSFLMLAALMFGVSVEANAQRRKPVVKRKVVARKPAPPKVVYYTVASNTKIRVRMDQEISSKTARVGDRFDTKTTEPVYSTSGVIVIPEGSTIVGRVDSVQAARKGGKPGTIDVSFVEVRLPNGKTRAINGTLTDLSSDDANSDSEGSASGDKTKYRKPIFIGGGAAGGAIIGAIAGGGKGAVIGGIIGGIGGLITETQTKGENAEVKTGTEFGVILNQSVSMTKYQEQ